LFHKKTSWFSCCRFLTRRASILSKSFICKPSDSSFSDIYFVDLTVCMMEMVPMTV
jgi:hypothetical protein